MRYLNKFESFFQTKLLPEGVDADDLRDICLDITDYGKFHASVNTIYTGGVQKHYVLISLSDVRDYDGFTFGEVKDVLLRLKDFLGKNYGGCSALISGDPERVSFDINNEESIDYLDKAYNKIDAPGIGNIVIWIV